MADEITKSAAKEEDARVEKTADRMGCLLIGLLWVALLIHWFWPAAWGEEPRFIKWIIVGYGILVLLGLLRSLVYGDLTERKISFVVLAIIALLIVVGRMF